MTIEAFLFFEQDDRRFCTVSTRPYRLRLYGGGGLGCGEGVSRRVFAWNIALVLVWDHESENNENNKTTKIIQDRVITTFKYYRQKNSREHVARRVPRQRVKLHWERYSYWWWPLILILPSKYGCKFLISKEK